MTLKGPPNNKSKESLHLADSRVKGFNNEPVRLVVKLDDPVLNSCSLSGEPPTLSVSDISSSEQCKSSLGSFKLLSQGYNYKKYGIDSQSLFEIQTLGVSIISVSLFKIFQVQYQNAGKPRNTSTCSEAKM